MEVGRVDFEQHASDERRRDERARDDQLPGRAAQRLGMRPVRERHLSGDGEHQHRETAEEDQVQPRAPVLRRHGHPQVTGGQHPHGPPCNAAMQAGEGRRLQSFERADDDCQRDRGSQRVRELYGDEVLDEERPREGKRERRVQCVGPARRSVLGDVHAMGHRRQ